MKLTKNGQVNRFCVVFYALFSLAAALLVCVYLLLPFNQMSWLNSSANLFRQQPILWVLLIVFAAVYCAWSIYLIVNALSRKPRVDKSSVSLQSGETGSVRVSISALDTLVKEAVSNVKGVGEIKTYIINHEDSITVKIEMELLSEEHIPNVTMLMQRDIKSFIEEYSGIAVREVSIMVLAIKITEKPQLRQDEAIIEISPAVYVEEDPPEAEIYEPEEPREAREPEEPEFESADEQIEESEAEPEIEAEFETNDI
jgi:uncharacterized alkaline shock family protein YloU